MNYLLGCHIKVHVSDIRTPTPSPLYVTDFQYVKLCQDIKNCSSSIFAHRKIDPITNTYTHQNEDCFHHHPVGLSHVHLRYVPFCFDQLFSYERNYLLLTHLFRNSFFFLFNFGLWTAALNGIVNRPFSFFNRNPKPHPSPRVEPHNEDLDTCETEHKVGVKYYLREPCTAVIFPPWLLISSHLLPSFFCRQYMTALTELQLHRIQMLQPVWIFVSTNITSPSRAMCVASLRRVIMSVLLGIPVWLTCTPSLTAFWLGHQRHAPVLQRSRLLRPPLNPLLWILLMPWRRRRILEPRAGEY